MHTAVYHTVNMNPTVSGGVHVFVSLPQESCCYYWPENVEESVVCGRLRVTLQRVTSHGDCVVRSLEVVEDKLESKIVSQLLTVTQMQLTSWPVHGLPHTSAVLSLIDHLTMAQRSSSGKPTVVMCRSESSVVC